MQVYTFNTRNRFVAVLAALLVLGAGAALLLVGLALLAGVAVAGGVLGAGVMAYRAIRGGRGAALRDTSASQDLDPALEVFAEPRRVEPSAPNDEPRRIAPE
jgi:hypothetical protein